MAIVDNAFREWIADFKAANPGAANSRAILDTAQYAFAAGRKAQREMDAALSAQPSPGGQDARAQFEVWLAPSWSREGQTDSEGDFVYHEDWVQGAWMAWQNLAARRPVWHASPELFAAARDFYNETVADPTVRISCASPEQRDAVTTAGERLRTALAAPPAQDVIDSQAVLHD